MSDTRRDFVNLATGMPVLLCTQAGLTEQRRIIDPAVTSGRATSGMKSFRLAAISTRSFPATPEKNLEHLATWLAHARDKGAELACFAATVLCH